MIKNGCKIKHFGTGLRCRNEVIISSYQPCLITACAAASLAMGTRKGEQLT